MTLTVGSRRIADGRVQGVGLQPIVGAYELVFSLYLLRLHERRRTCRVHPCWVPVW